MLTGKRRSDRASLDYLRIGNHDKQIIFFPQGKISDPKKMGSQVRNYKNKPHAVCIPFPAQGHVNPMLKLAKLLHSNGGFHITFVNTEYNHRRLLKSRGLNSLDGLPDFKFEAIPDGLPPSDADATQSIPMLCESIPKHSPGPFLELVTRINSSDDAPPVTCIVSDGCMSFTLDAAEELGIPEVLFWTPSACGVLGYAHYRSLIEKGLIPLKDASYLTNGYLDTKVDGIPGMGGIKLKDFPNFIRTTDINDIMLNYLATEISRTRKASAVIINTFDAFEKDVVDSLSMILPPIYTIGPLQLLVDQIPTGKLKSIGSNLWREQEDCLDWLDTKKPNSVVYVNFGSITVMTRHQLEEFAWGLTNSKKQFLWIIRPDLVVGESSMLPEEFVLETKDRGMLASWCPQEQVLKHPAIGGFLSHMGWNSTLESVSGGVPFVCWPFFAEQQTNCWFACSKWGIGLEIDSDVKRDEVKELVWELMDGEKGKEMRRKAMEWKAKAEKAISPCGSSYNNMLGLVKFLLQL